MAIYAWPNSKEALASLNEVEQLRSDHPGIESLEHSHLTIHQYDEYDEWDYPRDLLGHNVNIFASTDTEEIKRSWGAFCSHHLDSLFELERPLPMERHYAFAEACSQFEGSLYEKAQQLFQYDGSSAS